ncbi:MAG TPA: hypothetical protein VEX86_06720 [Longimicrobium sp.]|nr:hypothetical protein [Longimicrobium sp.]
MVDELAPLHVLVTCTKGKTAAPASGLQLAQVAESTPEARAEQWIERLVQSLPGTVALRDLYAGDHWQVALSLLNGSTASGRGVTLWVCSAGYGLLPLDCAVAPYSATFSSGHRDSVYRAGDRLSRAETFRRWWSALAGWEGPREGAPRTVRDLASRAPGAAIVVVASEPYLRACAGDLVAAAGVLDRPSALSVVSAGARVRDLERHLLRFGKELRARVGGGDMSLNPRVARDLLRHAEEPTVEEFSRLLDEWRRDATRPAALCRPTQTDAEVLAFVHAELDRDAGATWSALLRKLRDQKGLACEQKRFRRVYGVARHARLAES